ncbi:NAD(P)-dependent oxidoreductase [Paeniroseomonas aquatica]|uniref:NAD(P)-dependent oxidoreductase n=1 Tax=Paeniroseomonas aquatica TaxID=373043 RepID=A0ABT8A979_9PROT|nr:NAD(P)-dependent oxidoreductase [Paeniroseomonas aquatica]MDN3566363.1 NAD(P)-dependent oxidoreductase [Paeniroseomonas aquatica]
MKVGFIGLGNMGGPMCRNLIKGVNHEVVVYDLDPAAMAACTAVGGTAGTGLEALAAECDVILTSLPTPKHVEAVAAVIGAHAGAGTVLIDLSTNAPAVVRRLAEELAAKGIGFLDSPVTGGVIRATDGSIVIMVGGEAATVEANRGLLASFSSQVVHVGPVGSGSVAKLINNMLGLCNMAIAAEGLMLGALAGIDMGILAGIISNGSGDSAAFRGMANRALKGNFNASFALDLAYKDVGLAVDLAAEHGLPGLMAPEALNLMRMGRAMGLGGQDSTSVLQVYEKIMGKEARS